MLKARIKSFTQAINTYHSTLNTPYL